jgi:molecular chaperone GrpE
MKKMEPSAKDKRSGHEVKSAMEIALEKALADEEAPIELATEQGTVSMTFEELKNRALKTDELQNDLLYKHAEFENYRKRTAKEREELLQETVRVGELVEILELLDRALQSDGDTTAIIEGIQIVRDKMWSLLESKGVERTPGVGEPFDPNHHEAVAQQPHDSIPEGNVALEYQPGFKIGERVIRPAKVVVSSGPQE